MEGFNPSQPRDDHGRWTDGGGFGVAVSPHATTGHNSNFAGTGGAFLRGAVSGGSFGGSYGVLTGAAIGGLTAGPGGALAGAAVGLVRGVVGGVVAGAVSGGLSAAIDRHEANAKANSSSGFWHGRGGTAVHMAARVVAGVGGGLSGYKASSAAGGAAERTFYGGRSSTDGFSTKPGGFSKEEAYRAGFKTGEDMGRGFKQQSKYGGQTREEATRAGVERERARMAERMATLRSQDPVARKAAALQAKANDRSVTPAERVAFQAKADEFLRRHRTTETRSGAGRHVATRH